MSTLTGTCKLHAVRNRAGRQAGQVSTRAEKKGFGKAEAPKQQPEQKVRLGTPSKAELKKQEAALKQFYASSKQPEQDMDAKDDDVVPTVITDRMLKRVLTFAGAPVFLGIMLYPLFYYLKIVAKVEVPYGAVFLIQSMTFGLGLLGISYGAISASWDPSRPGSGLGWNEFKANLAAILGKMGDGK